MLSVKISPFKSNITFHAPSVGTRQEGCGWLGIGAKAFADAVYSRIADYWSHVMDYICMKKVSYFSTTGNSRIFFPVRFYVLEATDVLQEPNRCELFSLVGVVYL